MKERLLAEEIESSAVKYTMQEVSSVQKRQNSDFDKRVDVVARDCHCHPQRATTASRLNVRIRIFPFELLAE